MRRPDWQQRLSDYLAAREMMPFAWGSNDCCTFAAGAVEAITGEDLAAHFAPYSGAGEALRLVGRHGGIEALASAVLGPSVPPAFAAVGDVVLFSIGGRCHLAICNGTSALGPAPLGTFALSMEAARVAWKV